MALEQLRAFRDERALSELGPTDPLAPDSYPLLRASELRDEHSVVSAMLELSQAGLLRDHGVRDQLMLKEKPFSEVLGSNSAKRTSLYLALLERAFSFDAKLGGLEGFAFSNFFDYGQAANAMSALFEAGVDHECLVAPTLEWFACYRFNYYATPLMERVLTWISKRYTPASLPAELREGLIALDGQIRDASYAPSDAMKELLAALLGDGPWRVLAPCEVWTKTALDEINSAPAETHVAWLELLAHCQGAVGARPSAKWLKAGREHLLAVGTALFVERAMEWFPLADAGRIRPVLGMSWENTDERQRMNELNAIVLRGLLWLCPMAPNPDLVRAIGKLASSGFRKIRGLGPRAVKVGNAAVYALGEIGTPEAVGQLAMLKARVKFGTALKEIEKAFAATAAKLKLPVDEIEEMAVPAYGLTGMGVCEEPMGEFTARLTVTGSGGTELVWLKADGKAQKSVPASVKAEHAEELKELQGAAKDIQRMLPAQRERIDTLFLQQKSWPLAVWRERYLDHPLVGVIARRLIWEFTTDGKTTTGIWFDPSRSSGREPAPPSSAENQSRLTSATRLVDLDLRPIASLGAETTVRLWHPIGKDMDEILAWRAWLDEQQIQQPFKQAHREVYLLTDAERNTRTYSNRYAAHVLRQHQFNALCAARGWKNKLRLLVDAEFPPATLYLPKWNLRAEFWIEGAGDNYGTDTNETGTFLYLTTDQVRFYRLDAAQATSGGFSPGYTARHGGDAVDPLALEEIPPLVFSEVMRDVDLFVGVASVGNDPNWADGGPDGRYQAYWQSYSFGDLSATAKTRREVLTRLLPRLKIAAQCSLAEKFLVVKGSVRTYKIHLGSGNILMEPNDQYLCIVPKQSAVAGEGKVLLPFEGDTTLSVILSKAFLLAEDAKIKDSSIVSQIRQR